MHSFGSAKPLLAAALLVMLAGCATTAAEPVPPAGAERSVRTEANGDVIEEYRVGGMVRMVKVTPRFGVPYTYVDRDGDGRMDKPGQLKGVYYKLYSW